MKLSKRAYYVLLGLLALAVGIFLLRLLANQGQLSPTVYIENDSLIKARRLWLWGVIAALLIFIIDFLQSRKLSLRVARELPPTLALGVKSTVTLTVENANTHHVNMHLHELYSEQIEALGLPTVVSVRAKSKKTVQYDILPIKRGLAEFKSTQISLYSKWHMWQFTKTVVNERSAKVFPNFAPVVSSLTMGLATQIAQLGIHLQQRRGEGSEFHQLREFREGDVLRQIDWNATARYRKPISRDYQDETDQEVVFLLDCGRRMRHQQGVVSHFDQALNALLLCSYIAMRQGDAVGMATFAGPERWFSPVKNPANINSLLNHLYDIHSSIDASDYLQAAEYFLSKNRKRSLVVIITALREDDMEDLQTAVALLQRKHLVLVANIKDANIEQVSNLDIDSLENALAYSAITDYLQQTQYHLKRFEQQGVVIADAEAPALHLHLVQAYLRIKRSGKL